MGVAPMLDPRLDIYALRAPISLIQGGYAWFDINWDSEEVVLDQDAAVENRDLVLAWIEKRVEPGSRPLLICGFSQGAMLSLGIGLARPDLVSGMLLLSGGVLPRFAQLSTAPIEGMPALVQHGLGDTVLPIHHGREVRDLLAERKAALTYTEYPMGHEVSLESLTEAHAWISSRV